MASGGFGREAFGDPMGGGGPLRVVRALAVAGQVVRVVFSEQPLHRSPSGPRDALNPANYAIVVVGGAATAPAPVGVDVDPIVGPTRAVGNGTDPDAALERGMDVHLDRPLVAGVTYQVTVRNVLAAAGGVQGAPYAAQFAGVTPLQATRLPARPQDLVDFQNPPASGAYVIDDSGDVAPEDPEAGLRKRVFRRLSTRKDAFATLPGYGLAIPLKGVAHVAQLSALRVDAVGQIGQEPDVAQVAVSTSLNSALGIVTISTMVKSRRGATVPINVRLSPDGSAVLV